MKKSLLCLLISVTVFSSAQGTPLLSAIAGYTVLKQSKIESPGLLTIPALVGGWVAASAADIAIGTYLFKKIRTILDSNADKEKMANEAALFLGQQPMYESMISLAGIVGTMATAYAIVCASK